MCTAAIEALTLRRHNKFNEMILNTTPNLLYYTVRIAVPMYIWQQLAIYYIGK